MRLERAELLALGYVILTVFVLYILNTKEFNTMIDIYSAYILFLFLVPLILLRRSGYSLRESFGLNYRFIWSSAYLILFACLILFISLLYKAEIAGALFTFFVAPLSEEVTFRGLAVTLLKKRGVLVAVSFSAVTFSLAHLGVTNNAEGLFIRLVIGALFAYIFALSSRLTSVFALHTLFNVYTVLTAHGFYTSTLQLLSLSVALMLGAVGILDYFKTLALRGRR